MARTSLIKDWANVWELERIDEVSSKDPAFKKVSEIMSGIKKKARILDAGSGLGRWVFYFQKKGYKGFGVDVVPEAIKRAREYAEKNKLNCDFRTADIRALPFSKDFFSAIFSFGTIEHFSDSSKAVKEFYRTLEKGGKCFVTVPNVYSARTFLTRPILKILKNPKLGYQGYERSFTPKKLARIMEEAGFKETECGILPDGSFLGEFYRFIPVVGRSVFSLTKKISFEIENRQSFLGHTTYCIGTK